ncbi:hypothetical protein [Clostridium sp. MD294]|uniref:hypothetical protein n=1 Tax=Clostridium sp. MD294 TaxID=97138 RepID=UPI0003A5E21E|nr:hypothetical protein [Clostridium sp. MD294]NDO45668.1 hypothetical protein [Clostridium sp. MD294]
MGFSWYISSTEKGKRVVKDFTSNVSGGIPRQVKVYDINGELIEEYEGTFDIETNHPYQYTSVTSFCSTIILFAVCSSAWLKTFLLLF